MFDRLLNTPMYSTPFLTDTAQNLKASSKLLEHIWFRMRQFSLTYFSPMLFFYTPWKRQKGGIEMENWTKTD